MITEEQQLLAIENGLCMTRPWLEEPCDFSNVEASLIADDDFKPALWTPELRSRVIARIARLTPCVVNAAFEALPVSWVRHHDEFVPSGEFLCATMETKRAQVQQNLQSFGEWATTHRQEADPHAKR